MEITSTREPSLIRVVKEFLQNAEPYLSEILNRFDDFPLYIIGGAVRTPILNVLQSKKLQITDFDIVGSPVSI